MKAERKLMRVQVDVVVEGDEPFDMPSVDIHALCTIVAMYASARMENVGLLLLPMGEVKLSMLDKLPKRMTQKEPK